MSVVFGVGSKHGSVYQVPATGVLHAHGNETRATRDAGGFCATADEAGHKSVWGVFAPHWCGCGAVGKGNVGNGKNPF